MTDVIHLAFDNKAPKGLAEDLRRLADAVDRGEVTALVGAYIANGGYDLMFSASLQDSLVLSTLLHDRCIDKFKM